MQHASTSPNVLAPELTTTVRETAYLAVTSVPVPAPAPVVCLNCEAIVPDHFCGHCGQEAHTHRFTLGHFLHEIPHTILHVDKGLFYTAKEMTLRPAATLRHFLAGQRIRHFKPVAYVLLLAGLSSFIYAVLHLHTYNPNDPSLGPAGHAMQEHISTGSGKYMSWFMVGSLPLTALLTWALLRRARFNYAECLVINAYVIGTGTLVTMPFYIPYYIFEGTARIAQVSLCSMLVMFGYQTWAYASLLAPTGLSAIKRYVRGLIAAVLAFTVLMVVMTGTIYGLHWSTAKESFREIAQHARQTKRAGQAAPVAPAPSEAAPQH